MSQPFCTKDPIENKNYNKVLEIFCTIHLPWPSSLPLSAVDDITTGGRKQQQHPGQQKPHRPKALRRAAIEEDHGGTSAGDAPPTSMAMDPFLTPTNWEERRRIHPPRLHKPDNCPAADQHRRPIRTWVKRQGTIPKRRASTRRKLHHGEAPQSRRPHPHGPLADAGENVAETMKEPEGLIPPRRRCHRLNDAARKPTPR